MPRKTDRLIFTDLDGTLLDRDTYSFAEASEALARIRKHDVPLVLATSKTRVEIELYRRRLSNTHPFIVENGAAAFIPVGYFPQLPSSLARRDDYFLIELGLPHAEIRRALDKLKEISSFPLRGFGDMTPEEVARLDKVSEPVRYILTMCIIP